jgi:hypothetical protein
MRPTMPDSLSGLRAANPARVDDRRGGSVVAQATLERILADRGTTATTASPRRGRWPRGLALVLAAMLLGAGASVGATDPFGWWSANPDTAMYGVTPATHVRTPSAQEIGCRPGSAGGVRCGAGGPGRRYMKIDAIRPPAFGSEFSRARFTAAITQQLAAERISAAQAARFRDDLARVPDGLFTKLRLASHFGTYGGGPDANGRQLVPPAGVPEFLVCQDAGPALSCQDLNGDLHAPAGAGVYMAEPTSDWRPAPPRRQNTPLPPGISRFTPAEYRLLIDIARAATGSSSSSAAVGHPVPAPSHGP